jgi:long-chain acyl-CoA synthetase
MHSARQASTPAATGPARHAVELFNRRVAQSGPRVAMRYKQGATWRTLTWSDWARAAREIAAGLRSAGLGPGDRVCVLAQTRWEWVACDVGILMGGGVTVPIYPSNLPDQVEYIVNDCGAALVVVEDPHQLEKLLAERPKLYRVRKVILIADVAQLERPDAKGRTRVTLEDVLPAGHEARSWVVTLAELRTAGQGHLSQHVGDLEKTWEAIGPDHVFTIVYTSGTTGPPKGVVLTHGNLTFEVAALDGLLALGEDDEQLLFLPLAHIFARMLEWASVSRGACIAFAESIPQLIANMKETQPTFMGAVPRVYEKAYAKLVAGLAEKKKHPVTRRLVDWALGVGREVSQLKQRGQAPSPALALKARLADRLLFDKVRDTFGGRLRFFVSGGAPLAREIAEFFHAAGILILEAYGLTETTGGTNVNRPNAYRFGTVGQALPGVEVKIAADGEVLMRGKNILREYWGKPDATREAIDADGWFHSGDIGVIEDGYLRITDRKKDIIVTAGGKNVAPQNIEGALKAQCPFVSQVMVHGDRRPYLVALVTMNEEQLAPWARENGVAGGPAEWAQDENVRRLYQAAFDQLNQGLASYETVKKFTLLPRDFSQDAGELTPTLKVKRKFASEKYKAVLDGMYAAGE